MFLLLHGKKHFKGLMQPSGKNPNENDSEFTEYINNETNWQIFNELCARIKDEEVSKAISSLKRGKTCGLDLISNEMIKACGALSPPCIKQIVQHDPCLWTPTRLPGVTAGWNHSHKGGDRTDPNRYRGISIMSCMGKLFCTVLNNRLLKFIEKNELRSKHQIGFTKDCRTSDHMLALKTMIDKYNQEKPKAVHVFHRL